MHKKRRCRNYRLYSGSNCFLTVSRDKVNGRYYRLFSTAALARRVCEFIHSEQMLPRLSFRVEFAMPGLVGLYLFILFFKSWKGLTLASWSLRHFAFCMNGFALDFFTVIVHCTFNKESNDRQKTDSVKLSMVSKH